MSIGGWIKEERLRVSLGSLQVDSVIGRLCTTRGVGRWVWAYRPVLVVHECIIQYQILCTLDLPGSRLDHPALTFRAHYISSTLVLQKRCVPLLLPSRLRLVVVLS